MLCAPKLAVLESGPAAAELHRTAEAVGLVPDGHAPPDCNRKRPTISHEPSRTRRAKENCRTRREIAGVLPNWPITISTRLLYPLTDDSPCMMTMSPAATRRFPPTKKSPRPSQVEVARS